MRPKAPAALLLTSLSALLVLLALSTCRKSPEPASNDTDAGTVDEQIQPIDPPNGTTVVGFKFNQQGMMRGRYYSIRQVDGGFECADTGDEVFWLAMDGEETVEHGTISDDGTYAYEWLGKDPLSPDNHCSRTSLTEEDMVEFTELLTSHGVFGWDGFDEVWTPPAHMEVTDTGTTFNLDILLSDGTHISAHGIDSYPPGYNKAINAIQTYFEDHADWSRYYPTSIPMAGANWLIIEFSPTSSSPSASSYKIELWHGRRQWSVVMRDPHGEALEAGTDIADYGTIENGDDLPFDTFLGIIERYDIASWNQTKSSDGDGKETWRVTVSFDNGQAIEIFTNQQPENYESFKAEVIDAIVAYYEQVRP